VKRDRCLNRRHRAHTFAINCPSSVYLLTSRLRLPPTTLSTTTTHVFRNTPLSAKMANPVKARENKPKKRREVDPSPPSHPPHQTTAQKSATSHTNMADPVTGQETILKRKGRRDLKEQEQEEKLCAHFAALEISDSLASPINVPGRQSPKKKIPGVATVKTTRKQRSVAPAATDDSSKTVSASRALEYTGLDRTSSVALPRFGAGDVKEPAIASPPNFDSSDTLTSRASQALKDTGIDWTEKVCFPRFGGDDLVSASFLALTDAKPAIPSSSHVHPPTSCASTTSSVPKVSPFAALVPASTLSGNRSSPSTAIAPNRDVSSGLCDGTLSTSPYVPPSTSLFADRSVPLFDGSSRSPFDSPSASLLVPCHSHDLASTLSPARVPSLGVDAGETSSANANATVPNRLLDLLPQELQDAVFGFAYTEPNFNFVYKRSWESRQTELRKRTGKLREEFPPHKVNEWMVSKKYFQAAARAWIGFQTSLEVDQSEMAGDPVSLFSHYSLFRSSSRFHEAAPAGLFSDFGRTFVVDTASHPNTFELISQCRRLRYLICIVRSQFFPEIDRGFAWEVEFTDEDLMNLLEKVGFSVPSSVEGLKVQHHPYPSYVDTDDKKSIFSANVAKLGRVMWRYKAKDPHPSTANDHGALYLGSKISFDGPSTELAQPTRQPIFGKGPPVDFTGGLFGRK
jgi:hypothetical protein